MPTKKSETEKKKTTTPKKSTAKSTTAKKTAAKKTAPKSTVKTTATKTSKAVSKATTKTKATTKSPTKKTARKAPIKKTNPRSKAKSTTARLRFNSSLPWGGVGRGVKSAFSGNLISTKAGLALGFVLGFFSLETLSSWHDMIRLIGFTLFSGFLASRFLPNFSKKSLIRFSPFLGLLLLASIWGRGFPFASVECEGFGGIGCYGSVQHSNDSGENNPLDSSELGEEKSETVGTEEIQPIEGDPKFINWDFPQSTPIRNRFAERIDEYQHFPVLQKGEIRTLNVEIENAPNANIILKKGDTIILETKDNTNVTTEKTSDTVSRITIKVPVNIGENKFKLLLQNQNGDPITERDMEILRVEKVMMLYGDSLSTGYPEGRLAGISEDGSENYLRTWFDAESKGMTISKNQLAIPTPGRFDAAYEEGGLHIYAQDFFAEKAKNVFIWNEARNGETVLGAELRFDQEGFAARLQNISEALPTDLSTDIVHLMLGTNDAREQASEAGLDLAVWEENARKLVDKILAQNINPENLIISLSPKNEYDPKDLRPIWEKIISEKGLTKGLDLYDIFEKNPEYLHPDNVHFSDIGKKAVGKMLGEFLHNHIGSSSAIEVQ